MSPIIQILLIVISILVFLYIIKNVKKGKLRTDYALFWIFFFALLIVISIFPQIIYGLSNMLDIVSPINVVFLIIIFLLILLTYTLFVKVSMLEEKLKNLIQEVAFIEKSKDQDND